MAQARKAMIVSQLRTSGVNAPFVLRRMGAVAREDFVPADSRNIAYMDRAIRLENGGGLPAPLVQGVLLQEANPQGTEHALVIDCGSGYLAQLLSPLVAQCDSLSVEEALSGKKIKGKADLLLIDGAVEHLPKPVLNRLADGARIFTGLVEKGITRIATGRKGTNGVALFPIMDLGVPRIPAFDKPQSWSF